MSSYKTDQRRLTYQGREFHFVSCEGQRANAARKHEEIPPTWCLMAAGKRWEVMPQVADQPDEEVDRQLVAWIEENMAPRR